MADLYDTLGVAKDATKAAIKSAYRSKAKAAHPDTGGDPAAFHAIERAYRVLSDDEKRARYDEHGGTEFQPDNAESEAASVISAIVDRFINDDQAKYKNLVDEIRKAIKGDIATGRRSIDEGRKYELKTIDLQKRVKGKNGALLISMFEHKLRDCREAIASLERQIAIRERALEMIEDADFAVDTMSVDRARQQNVFTQAAADRLYNSAFFKGWPR
jgi:DnaJ-class molecular chaperone